MAWSGWKDVRGELYAKIRRLVMVGHEPPCPRAEGSIIRSANLDSGNHRRGDKIAPQRPHERRASAPKGEGYLYVKAEGWSSRQEDSAFRMLDGEIEQESAESDSK
jgi:hypothetical protein